MTQVSCPKCRKQVAEEGPFWPFCSAACRGGDFLGWLDERYSVSEPLPDAQSDLEPAEGGDS